MMLIWFSLLTAPGMVTIGALGPIFGLSVADSILITVIGTLVGSVFPAWTATLVPLTGLRQVAFSRYAFGIQGSKLCGALTVFVNIGYAVIGAILAGQFLRAVSGGSLDISLGIVLVVLLALVVSFLGYHVLHMYESVAWILIFILLMVQFGQSAPRFPSDITSHELQGIDYVGSGLTFFSIMFGQCVAWCACAGDYYVHFPADVNKWKVAGLTWLGMALPTIFGAVLGCYIGGAVISDQDLAAIYATDGIGQVILDLLHPSGFSKFVGVFYAFASRKHQPRTLIEASHLRICRVADRPTYSSGKSGRDLLFQCPRYPGLACPLHRRPQVHLGPDHRRCHPRPGTGRSQRLREHPRESPAHPRVLDHLLRRGLVYRTLPLPAAVGRLRSGRLA